MSWRRRLVTAADAALDRSLVGYTRLGPWVRRNWWPAGPGPEALVGRTILVTGGTSGIGAATATGLAALGAGVVVLGRSELRLHTTVERIRAEVPGSSVASIVCDMSDLHEVRRCSAELAETYPRLHGLVHNAGTMTHERTETAGGHERQFATHVLGPHLMTAQLLPLLRAAVTSSVVFVSSGGMYTAPPGYADPESRAGPYSGARVYARTKRMQVLLARAWSERVHADGIRVQSMHPGWVETPGLAEHLPRFRTLTRPLLRTAEQGADTVVWLVATRPSPDGTFWHDRALRPTDLPWFARPGGRRDEGEDGARELLRYVERATATVGQLTGV